MVTSSETAANPVISLQKHSFTRCSLDPGMSLHPGLLPLLLLDTESTTGCGESNAFHCFPCLLFPSVGTEVLWTTTGGARPKTSLSKIQSNDSCHSHLDNTVTTGLALLSSSMKATGLLVQIKVTEEILYIPAGVKVNDGTGGKEKRENRVI